MPISESEYQSFTRQTAQYPDANSRSTGEKVYLALGLAGEGGELANKIKKFYRQDPNPPAREEILNELGDALWYLTKMADAFGFTIEEVRQSNYKKLSQRMARGTIKGGGDER